MSTKRKYSDWDDYSLWQSWDASTAIAPRPSDFGIKHAQAVIKPRDRIATVARASHGEQRKKHNLHSQGSNLGKVAPRLGARAVHAFRFIYNAGDRDEVLWHLRIVFRWCEKNGIHVVLFETPDRIARHTFFKSMGKDTFVGVRCKDLQATGKQWRDIQKLAARYGVTICTDIHPDASPREIERYQALRGQREKGRKGGRPKKTSMKKRKAEHFQDVVELASLGVLQDVITELTEVPIRTVKRWLKESRGGLKTRGAIFSFRLQEMQ
jgi:hypothetical protein